jgi:hypothetical protein
MTDDQNDQVNVHEAPTDVFAAARWLGAQWNSSARAVSAHEVEWQCTTWGSGRGRADWLETASFDVAAAAIGLQTSRNWEGRDELVVTVPLDQFRQVADLLDRLGDEPEAWPWLDEDVEDDLESQISIAAKTLALSPAVIEDNHDLRSALRID